MAAQEAEARGIRDSEANLVYTVNSKSAKATIMTPCHKTKQKTTKKEECLYIITKRRMWGRHIACVSRQDYRMDLCMSTKGSNLSKTNRERERTHSIGEACMPVVKDRQHKGLEMINHA